MQPRELTKPVLNPPANIIRITDAAGLTKLTDFFSRCGGVFGWDCETTPVKDFYWRKLRTMQFGNATEQYVIDLRAFCDNDPDKLHAALGGYGANLTPGPQLVVDTIRPVLCSKDFLKVGVNLGFEYQCCYWQLGLHTFHFYDCSMVEKCIYAGSQWICNVAGMHSMKNYAFYSMEAMCARYFGWQIDKTLQESFSLECDLTPEQDEYGVLDTRYPLGIMQIQKLILAGATYKGLKAKGAAAAKYLEFIDPMVTGDNLQRIAQIENNAIPFFEDMHIHGERLDTERWNARVAKSVAELKTLISGVLDPIFIPIVGSKSKVITDQDIADAQAKWKAFNTVTDAELKLKSEIHYAKKKNPLLLPELEAKMTALVENRKEKKEVLKKQASDLGKQRTKIKNLVAKCEGEALINYGSDAQLLKVIQTFKGLAKVDGLDDDTLEKFKHISVMAAIQKYHGLKKDIGTYGTAWTTQWKTKPCKDEGWLHPGDGLLHCVFNQYDAETGRSSSEKPNGQNLPQDKEVRSCFIADPPDESIRISNCCEAETHWVTEPHGHIICNKCGADCGTHAEEYVKITADMSGAELRIIAELANDPIWIGAFARGEDVHSVGTEILYEEEWPKLALPDCAYFKLNDKGEPQRKKCKCPEHGELRNNNKSTNFLLAYGGGPSKLAQEIKKSLKVAQELMALHASKFPKIWDYLDKSGLMARTLKKSFDMFGRRRLFPEPTRERAREWFISDNEEKLRLDEDATASNIETFTAIKGRGPDKEELYHLSHRQPTDKEVNKAMMGLSASIGRQGKNHAIQGTNATIIKLASGCGFCPEGKPYLWHIFPLYKAKVQKMVHDELVVQCPKRFAKAVAAEIGDAFRRAAAEKMKKVVMEFDFNIATYWCK